MSTFCLCITKHSQQSTYTDLLLLDYAFELSYELLISNRISHAVSSRKRVDIVAKAKQLGVKITNAKARVTTES